ncbi:MAG: TonB family protein [Gammaproteobacteria bacterium]
MPRTTTTHHARASFPRFRHRSAGFFVSGFAVSTVVVSALFWLMYQLVSIVQPDVKPTHPPRGIHFVMVKPDETPPEVRKRRPQKPPVIDQPLPQRTAKWSPEKGSTTIGIAPPENITVLGPMGKGKIGIGERSYMPLAEIQPVYPERALVWGIEGSCVVVYTITKTGSVKDVRIDESQCTSSLFHAAAAKTASKYKYAPRIVDGEMVETRNVAKLFRFSITD